MLLLIDAIVLFTHAWYLYFIQQYLTTYGGMIDYTSLNTFTMLLLTILLLINFYHFYKRKYHYCVIEMFVYALFIKFDQFIQLFYARLYLSGPNFLLTISFLIFLYLLVILSLSYIIL